MKNERYSSSLAFRDRKTVKKAALIFRHDADINQKDQDGNVILQCMPSEPHGEGDIAVELWKKLEPGEK